jgi:hypothetical protein
MSAALLTLPARVFAQACTPIGGPLSGGSVTETFQSPTGTDNVWQAMIGVGNDLNPDFTWSGAPLLWGHKSGQVIIGSQSGGAFWMRQTSIPSPTGYNFTGSFIILQDGLSNGQAVTLFISKPTDWSGDLAAWRLYFVHSSTGQLGLRLVLGLNTATNNPDAMIYQYPIIAGHAYTTDIYYDTERRFYMWTVNGKTVGAGDMPCDYPTIATQIMGSSGSSSGRNTVYAIDNVSWWELPE